MREVVVIGAGVAGASAAYHLVQAGVRVVVVEAGVPGVGREQTHTNPQPPHPPAPKPLRPADETVCRPYLSGSAVLANPGVVKFMVSMFPDVPSHFAAEHGEEAARRYFLLARLGLELEKQLARRVLPNVASQLVCNGSVWVCEPGQEADMERECALMARLGCNVRLLGPEEVALLHGAAAGFTRGVLFPDDAAIDSPAYAQALLAAAARTGLLEVCSGVAVVRVESVGAPARARVTLADGRVLHADRAVVATGALFLDRLLAGLLRPCWSYLVAIADPRGGAAAPPPPPPGAGMTLPSSPNFFTFHFTHDWSTTGGIVRISGEDHRCALRPPQALQRSTSLAAWAVEKYPYLKDAVALPPGKDGDLEQQGRVGGVPFLYRYGVYSETPDGMPLVGRPDADSAVCYLLGCNAWGQSILSYCASLVPGLLGITPLDATQQALAELVAVSRFSLAGLHAAL